MQTLLLRSGTTRAFVRPNALVRTLQNPYSGVPQAGLPRQQAVRSFLSASRISRAYYGLFRFFVSINSTPIFEVLGCISGNSFLELNSPFPDKVPKSEL